MPNKLILLRTADTDHSDPGTGKQFSVLPVFVLPDMFPTMFFQVTVAASEQLLPVFPQQFLSVQSLWAVQQHIVAAVEPEPAPAVAVEPGMSDTAPPFHTHLVIDTSTV